jgi:hypothetical protein
MSATAWQLGSPQPPTVCLCCGSRFDEEQHKRRGPYLTGPYVWACEWCWKKDYLFFPDKEGIYFKQIFEKIESSHKLEPASTQSYSLKLATGETLNCKMEQVPLDLIRLDTNNTRLKHIKGNLKEVDIERELWKMQSTRDLYRQIEYAGGLTDPPILDSRNVVREGNRRITCLRRLKEKIVSGQSELPLWKIDPVLCRILPGTSTEADVDIYLALEHVKGKQKWPAIDQAAHVYELVKTHRLSIEKIEKSLGLSRSRIEWIVFAYEKTSEYHLTCPEDNEWGAKYSYFYEFAKNPRLNKWIASPKNFKSFTKWLKRGQISRGEEIRRLPEIIDNKKLLTKIKKGVPFSKVKTKVHFDPEQFEKKTLDAFVKATEAASLIKRSSRKDNGMSKKQRQAARKLYEKLAGIT